MTQEIVQTLVCDVCESEDQVQTMAVKIGNGKQKYVELCAEHRQPLLDIQKVARNNPTPKVLDAA